MLTFTDRQGRPIGDVEIPGVSIKISGVDADVPTPDETPRIEPDPNTFPNDDIEITGVDAADEPPQIEIYDPDIPPTDPPPIETAPAVELQVPVTKTARTPEATPPPRRSTRVSKQPKSYLVNEKAYRLSFCETRQPRPYDIALPDRSSDSPRS